MRWRWGGLEVREQVEVMRREQGPGKGSHDTPSLLSFLVVTIFVRFTQPQGRLIKVKDINYKII